MAATDFVSDDAPSVEMTVILSIAPIGGAAASTTCGSTLTSRSSTAASPYAANASALRCHRVGLGLAPGQDGRGLGRALALDRLGDRGTAALLGLTLLGALDRVGLGQRGPAGPLALTGEAGLLGGGLGGGDGGLPLRVGVSDGRVLAGRLGLLLDLVPLGVGRLADLGVELALLELGVALGDLLLLGEDRLVPLGLGERAGRGRLAPWPRRSRPGSRPA